MKLKKIFLYIIPLIVAAVAVAAVFFYLKYHISYSGEMTLNVDDTVYVSRTSEGIPRIRAANDSDFFFTLGFLHAQERLSSLLYFKNLCDGNLESIITDENDRVLFRDLLELLNIKGKAAEIFSNLSETDQNRLIRYTAGVNAILSSEKFSGRKKYTWAIDDSVKILLLFEYSSSYLKNREFIFPFSPENGRKVMRFVPSGFVSVYEPEETAAVDALLKYRKIFKNYVGMYNKGFSYFSLNVKTGGITEGYSLEDMTSVPQMWFPVSAEIAGKEISGASICSLPFIFHGSNSDYSFSVFDAMSDTFSAVRYPVRRLDDRYQYLLDGQWKDFVKSVTDGRVYRSTEGGIVISHFNEVIDDDFVVCVNSPAMSDSYVSFLLNLATGIDEGTITGLKLAADCKKIIIRTENSLRLVISGRTDDSLKRGSVLLRNFPFYSLVNRSIIQKIDEKNSFYISGTDGATDRLLQSGLTYVNEMRFNRTVSLFGADSASVIEDRVSDTESEFYSSFYRILEQKLDKIPVTSAKLSVLYLSAWDGSCSLSEISPSIIQYLYFNLLYQTIRDDFSGWETEHLMNFYYLYPQQFQKIVETGLSDLFDDKETVDRYEDIDAILDRSFLVTMRMMHRNYGPYIEKWNYDKITKFSFHHSGILDRIDKKTFQSTTGDAYSAVKTQLDFDYYNEKLTVDSYTSLVSKSENGKNLIKFNFPISSDILSRYRDPGNFEFHPLTEADQSRGILEIRPSK